MQKKNILFLFSDQHRGDWLPFRRDEARAIGADELPLRMPSLRALMDEGVTFTRAVTNSPLCAPARACLASGMQYDRCGAYNNGFCYPLTQKTFYSVLQDGGYSVAGTGKFDLHKPILYWSKDGWIDQLGTLGFTDAVDSEGKYDTLSASYEAPHGPYGKLLHDRGLMGLYCRDYIRRFFNTNDAEPTDLPEDAYEDNWVTAGAGKMLHKLTQEEKPWFLMVNFSGPHDPWDVTRDMKARWADVQFPLACDYTGTAEELNAVRQNYAAMLENIDRNIGLLIAQLRESGQYENTVIIYASDHGEMMGDRNRFFKCVPYRGSIHIPLVIRDADGLRGKVRGELVELHDLAATITDYAGLCMPAGTDAISLRGLASKSDAPPIRDYQAVMLLNGLQNENGYPGYEEYFDYRKRYTDAELIAKFNLAYGISESPHSSVKMKTARNWSCIVTERYKLIESRDGEMPELYDLSADPWERNNLAQSHPDVVEQLRKKYDFGA